MPESGDGSPRTGQTGSAEVPRGRKGASWQGLVVFCAQREGVGWDNVKYPGLDSRPEKEC